MFKLSRWGKRIGLLALILILPQLGWANNHAGSKQDAQPTSEGVRLRLATTTSTENSGLLAHLLPPFEKKYGVKVDVVAVGTGQALQIGRNGDADVVMVHAPALEKKFVEEGYGIERIYFMYNDFVILGPESDPANIRKLETAKEAFAAIAQQNALFVSRGDNSGTHVKERGLWAEAGVDPSTLSQYREVGQGMGAVITIAGDQLAYTLSDRGTWLSYVAKNPLKILFQGDPDLFNPYGVIAVNPEKHPHVKKDLAVAFTQYLVSPEARAVINGYTLHGEQLFFAVKP